MNKLGLIGGALALTIGVTANLAYAADYTMKFATPSIKNADEISVHWLPKQELADQIEQLSNGRIEVQLFAKGQLGKSEDLPNQLRANVIQGFDCADGPIAPLFTDIEMLSIPYLFLNREIAWEVMDGPFGDALADKMAKVTGFRPLAYSELGYRHFSTTDTPITTLEDFQGLKIRTMTNQTHMEMVKGLGANPTPVAWDELYTALQTGLVEGQENPIANFIQPKLYEVQHTLTLDGHVLAVYYYLVNEQWYQSLPDDLKGVVRQAYKIAAVTMRGVGVATEQRDLALLKDEGMTVYTLSAAEKERFRQASQEAVLPIIEKKVDPDLLELLYAEVDKVEKKYGYK